MVKPNKCKDCGKTELKLSGLKDFKLVERRDFKPVEHG
jgi:hypothetical protein